MSQLTLTKTLTQEEMDSFYRKYEAYKVPSKNPYIAFQLKLDDCVITAYTSGKVVFQGANVEAYAGVPVIQKPVKTKITSEVKDKNRYPEAGSDEVGTGDYFGPVCVCASYVTKEDVPLLEKLGVKDSKAITDAVILKIAPVLEEKIVHSTLVLMPQKYNEVHSSNSMNVIKAKMHNQAYVNLSKKTDLPAFKIIDQFEEEGAYYYHIKKEPVVVRGIHFETKAENKYYAVATSSILARYAFLNAWKKMEKSYGFTFVKGAGPLVDKAGREFVNQYGKEALKYVAKLHFVNTDRILM